MSEQYTYAVARIRAKELSLLSEQDINRLMSCENYENCLSILRDKGWGDEATDFNNYETILNLEEKKVWQLMSELVTNKDIFNIILLPIDFHNLKAAIKGYITESLSEDLFIHGGTVESSYLTQCIKDGEFSKLPTYMVEPAKEAFDRLLHTSDGQLCDNIIDKALLEVINIEGQKTKVKLIRDYSELYVASADIKIAIRSQIMKKNIEFLKSMLVKCGSLDIEKLAMAAIDGHESLCNYLEMTPYADAITFINESLQRFELWCDNKIMELISREKYNSFSTGPIIAYVLARRNEIKVVRIILSGKIHRVENDLIKERLRMMYV